MQRPTTVIDTGPIVSILNQSDPWHGACLQALESIPSPLLTTWPVLTQAAYLLSDWSQATSKLFDLVRREIFLIAELSAIDIDPIERILQKYSDQKFQLADASLMYLLDREGIGQVLTLDRKDFSVFRKASGEAFEILPHIG